MCVEHDTLCTDQTKVCHINTDIPAVMTFVGVFAEADPYDTGNLIWGKDAVPPPEMGEERA